MAGNKYISNNAGTYTEVAGQQTSAGVGDANKIVALDASGKLDVTLMPTGIGADTATITASEALSAGDFVNIHNSSGVKVRKADASASGKEAHGFVKSAVSNGAPALVYFEGPNDAVSSVTAGVQFLSTTPGGFTTTAPSTAGQVVQRIGVGVSTTSINFESGPPLVLA